MKQVAAEEIAVTKQAAAEEAAAENAPATKETGASLAGCEEWCIPHNDSWLVKCGWMKCAQCPQCVMRSKLKSQQLVVVAPGQDQATAEPVVVAMWLSSTNVAQVKQTVEDAISELAEWDGIALGLNFKKADRTKLCDAQRAKVGPTRSVELARLNTAQTTGGYI